MAYTNSRTGITTYVPTSSAQVLDDEEAQVEQPSTATSLPPAQTAPQQSIFAPVNPQVRPLDGSTDFAYFYSPEELAQIGYQYVPESVERQRGRFGGDDYEYRDYTIPGHYIDPTRNAPFRKYFDDSDTPDWMYSTTHRSGDDRETDYRPLVVDPYKPIRPGDLASLRQYGLWQNLSDPNAPLYAGFRAQGITPTPYQMASMLLGQSGLGTRSTPEQWQAALGDMQLSPELAAAIRQRLQDVYQNRQENTGGMLGNGGFLGTGISTGDPTIDNLLSFGQGAMVGGNVGGTVATGNFDQAALEDAALQDALTLGSAALGPTVSGLVGGGMLGTLTGGAAGGALSSLSRGGDFEDIAQNAIAGAATAGGLRLGGQALAQLFPAEAPSVPSTATSFADAGSDSLKRQGMPPIFAQADTGTVMDAGFPGLSTADMETLGPIATQKALDSVIGSEGMLTADIPGLMSAADSQTLGPIATQKALEEAGIYFNPATGIADVLNGPGPSEQPKPPTPEDQRATEMSKRVEQVAKIGRALAKMHDGRGTPEDAPQREEGQSDGEYAQTLADYLGGVDPAAFGLDAETVAQHGAPGSPEAMQYLLDRADAIIAQLGLDPAFLDGADVDELTSALRSKTREELDALERALWTRGALGALSTRSEAVNPFSGETEELNLTPGQSVQGSRAAYERGRARELQRLGGLQGTEARGMLTGLLNRSPDLFDMQARADARALQEALAAQTFEDPDLKRHRYGFARSADYWRDLLDSLSPEQLGALLSTFGGDIDRSRAALSQLVG
jgi:hypothetical protein